MDLNEITIEAGNDGSRKRKTKVSKRQMNKAKRYVFSHIILSVKP